MLSSYWPTVGVCVWVCLCVCVCAKLLVEFYTGVYFLLDWFLEISFKNIVDTNTITISIGVV